MVGFKRVVVLGGVVLLTVAALSGCWVSGKTDKAKAVADNILPTPGTDDAVVVFLRPSNVAYAISASVFDVTGSEEGLIGVLKGTHRKLAYRVRPGEHMFMVIGESADFMRANLAGGKTYFARVEPRTAAAPIGTARFSLLPITKDELLAGRYDKEIKISQLTENTPEAYEWAKQHAANVKSMRERYFAKWSEKPEDKKPTLRPEDGR